MRAPQDAVADAWAQAEAQQEEAAIESCFWVPIIRIRVPLRGSGAWVLIGFRVWGLRFYELGFGVFGLG